MLSLYRKLEKIKAGNAAGKEAQNKVEAKLEKGIRLNRIDSQGRRFGVKDGVRRLEIAKNAIAYPDLISGIMALLPKTRHKQADQLRKKLSKPYKYSSFSRAE